jgi:hypothetical protein
MTTRTPPEIPVGTQKISGRFERWRSSHQGRSPIPEALWAAAAEVVREHGVFPDRLDSTPGARQAEAHGGIGQGRCQAITRTVAGGLPGVDESLMNVAGKLNPAWPKSIDCGHGR